MNKQQAYNLFIQQALKYGFSLFGTPKTGQITSYATGDDGYYQKGYPVSGSRYKDNGDGTITDRATGLMWTKKISDLGYGFWAGEVAINTDWATSLTVHEGLIYAGYSDWRMPNINELKSIVDYEKNNPAIDPIFENILNFGYWTSTTNISNTVQVWVVDFGTGISVFKGKIGNAYQKPVRGGTPA